MNATTPWPFDTTRPVPQSASRRTPIYMGASLAGRLCAAVGIAGTEGWETKETEYSERYSGVETLSLSDLTAGSAFGEVIWPDLKKLDELASLDRDWDSYGAEQISPDALASAYLLMMTIANQWAFRLGERVRPYVIVPVADGGVQLEWRGPGGIVEVEIGSDEMFACLFIPSTGGYEEYQEMSLDAARRVVVNVING